MSRSIPMTRFGGWFTKFFAFGKVIARGLTSLDPAPVTNSQDISAAASASNQALQAGTPNMTQAAEGGSGLAAEHEAHQERLIRQLVYEKEELLKALEEKGRAASRFLEVREEASSLTKQLYQGVEHALDGVSVIADSVSQIVGTSASTDAMIQEGRKCLVQALSSLEAVGKSIGDTLSLVDSFVARSRKVEDVLKEIADLAYFTRILSLNATIEAARAGEHGKGFRFLAEEVQKLAGTITQSTSDITELLKVVPHESAKTKEAVLRSANQVGEASRTVTRLDEALRLVTEELHSMDADLQDAHMMSFRVSQTRESVLDSLSQVKEASRLQGSLEPLRNENQTRGLPQKKLPVEEIFWPGEAD